MNAIDLAPYLDLPNIQECFPWFEVHVFRISREIGEE